MKNKEVLLSGDIDYSQSLFIIKILYAKIIAILDTFCLGSFVTKNQILNFYYISYTEIIEGLLRRRGFEKLLKEMPVLFENLIGNIDNIDVRWKNGGRQQAQIFLGKIETLFIKNGQKGYAISKYLENKLNEVDKAIVATKKHDAELQKQMEQEISNSDLYKNFQKIADKDSDKNFLENTAIKKYKPELFSEKNKGYFRLNKQSDLISIGGVDTRQFKLLQLLCAPEFGNHRSIEMVFDSIKMSNDLKNQRLTDSSLRRAEVLNIIENTIKELQKKLGGKVSFHFDEPKRKMWLHMEG